MSDWEKCAIADLCDSISETYHRNSPNVVLINTSDVLEGNILNHEFVPNKQLKGQFKKTFQKEDILFSEIRPANKRYAFVDIENTQDYIASTKLMVLRPDKKKVLPMYLYFLLTAKNMLDELQYLAETRSGTFPQITFDSELGTMPVALPDIITQAKIAGILKALDDKIALNQQINKNLEEQAQAIYEAWFVDFEPFGGEMPDDWRAGTAGEILEFYDSKRIPLSGSDREKMAKIYPYYGATSLMDYVEDYIFDGVYLLLGEDGTVVTEDGFPVLQYVDGKFWVNNHAHILTGRCGFSVEALYLLFSLTNIKHIVTGAVQPKISQTNLKKVEVIIPPETILRKFDDIIQPMFAIIRNQRAENLRLTEFRDALLPRLMSGEIDMSGIEVLPNSLMEAVADSREQRNLYGPFDSAEDAVASMLKD